MNSNRLLIGAATGRDDVSKVEYDQQRIHGNHAFSVLGACSISVIAMNFVLVRDPHARSNYVDELLTPSIHAELNSYWPLGRSSGAFWISWPKFLRFFGSITISTYASDYHDLRETASFPRSSTDPIPTFHFYIDKYVIRIDLSSTLTFHLYSIECTSPFLEHHWSISVYCGIEKSVVSIINMHNHLSYATLNKAHRNVSAQLMLTYRRVEERSPSGMDH
jgi:hypothetical protein